MSETTKSTSRENTLKLAAAAAEKKATDIVLIDISEVENSICDYFIVCTAGSENQMSAIIEEMRKTGWETRDLGKIAAEGMDSRRWAILDYFDVVVHVMLAEVRSYYKIEKLWADDNLERFSEEGEVTPLDVKELEDIYVEFDYDMFNAPETGLPEDFWKFDEE
jgi:ribosome-associated protein